MIRQIDLKAYKKLKKENEKSELGQLRNMIDQVERHLHVIKDYMSDLDNKVCSIQLKEAEKPKKGVK